MSWNTASSARIRHCASRDHHCQVLTVPCRAFRPLLYYWREHKLVPSVYLGIFNKTNSKSDPNDVTYSCPTFKAVQNGKAAQSMAATHAHDIYIVMKEPIVVFRNAKTDKCDVKPIMIFTKDGNPDGNTRINGYMIMPSGSKDKFGYMKWKYYGTIRKDQGWSLVSWFTGIVNFIILFFKTLVSPDSHPRGSGYTTDYRRPGQGPPRPPRRRFGGVNNQMDSAPSCASPGG